MDLNSDWVLMDETWLAETVVQVGGEAWVVGELPLRPREVLMRPERLGAFWLTRFSFSRLLVERVRKNNWRVELVSRELDGVGRGEVIYRLKTHGGVFHAVFFSNVIAEEEREDRVIAERWDAASALCEGELTAARLAEMRENVPRQEYGRADAETLVWTRGNRSSRFFDYVVDCLAEGNQPEAGYLAQGGYIFRSTAYYGNGKFGLASYEGIEDDHPLAGSYMPQMCHAWLFREFACDLAEFLAARRNPEAVKLAPELRRYLGIGNATGLGLVPFVLNNPGLTHAWVMVREVALGQVKVTRPTAEEIRKLYQLIGRCIAHFGEGLTDTKGLFADYREVAADLGRVLARLEGSTIFTSWGEVCEWGEENLHVESQELLHSLLLEVYPACCEWLVPYLEVPRVVGFDPAMGVGELRGIVEEDYGWALGMDLDREEARKYFWYFSADSQEPLMGVRGKDAGVEMERPLDIPFRVQGLMGDLVGCDEGELVGDFLLRRPEHRLIVQRVQSLRGLRYGEVRTNLMDAAVVPLYLQRFQLAQYGMERFVPQSIYWVRVTLMQGVPTAGDVESGWEGEWGFSLVPEIFNTEAERHGEKAVG